MAKAKTRQTAAAPPPKRTYLKQTDVPATSLAGGFSNDLHEVDQRQAEILVGVVSLAREPLRLADGPPGQRLASRVFAWPELTPSGHFSSGTA